MALRRVLVLTVILAAIVALPTLAFGAKDYRASTFDVRLIVEPGGSMLVTERITFVFGDDTFTYVYRGLPSRRIDGISVIGVAMDGRPFTPGDAAGQFEIKRQDNQRRVIWHFAELRASSHVFELSYRVAGVVRHEATEDLLEWYALPTKHTYQIACASVELVSPPGAGLLAPLDAEPTASKASGDNPVRLSRCGFAKDDSWLIRARYTARSIVSTPPAWQLRAVRTSRYMPLFLGLAGMILLTGLGGFIVFFLNHRSSVRNDSRRLHPVPPDTLPINLGATLAQGGTATWATALATLFDLANHGIVRIEEIKGGSVFRKQDFIVTPHGQTSSLRPSQRALYDLIFLGKSGPRPSLKFSELARVVASGRRWKSFTHAVREELRQQGVFDEERGRTRLRVTVAGVFVALLGLVLLIAAVPFLSQVGDASLMIGVATGIVGLVGLAVGQSITPFTDEAVRRAGAWQAYGRHLKHVSKEPGSSATTAEAFARALPAAVAFGTAVAWAKALEKSGTTMGPTWLAALPDSAAGHHMAATVAMLSSSHAAGGQAGHGAGGSAGAAGGGSSGAG